MTDRTLLGASNRTLREDNARLRKQVRELEEVRLKLTKSLLAREAEFAAISVSEELSRRRFQSVYQALGILADAVKANTTEGRLAKDYARSYLRQESITIPSTLGEKRAPRKKLVKRRKAKRS